VAGRKWNIVTGEYPPQFGGVADHTWQLAHGLAACGEDVEVWAPRCSVVEPDSEAGVTVHRLVDHFGWRGILQLNASVARTPDAVLVVQYVPHAFGWKAMNLPLCLWLAARERPEMAVIFHEVAYPIGANQSMRHNALGHVTRLMASKVARAAKWIYVAIPDWERMLPRSVRQRTPIRWMPVPSNVARVDDPSGSRILGHRYRGNRRHLIGHFGSYGIMIRTILVPLVETVLSRRADIAFLLMGDGSREFLRELVAHEPSMAGRVHATGRLRADDLSRHLSACDLMVQPYPDGISTRRGSAMAALSHGIAVVTNSGALSELLWHTTRGVALVRTDGPDGFVRAIEGLLEDEAERNRVANAGHNLYTRQFDLRHTIAILRDDIANGPAFLESPSVLNSVISARSEEA
jgi:glycosyltransferase involved in cell wall biosynthesis